MTAPRTTDDLAFEAMELIRRKNIKFNVQTGGRQWACKFSPRDVYEQSRSSSSSSTATTSTTGSSSPQIASTASSVQTRH